MNKGIKELMMHRSLAFAHKTTGIISSFLRRYASFAEKPERPSRFISYRTFIILLSIIPDTLFRPWATYRHVKYTIR